MAAKTFTIQDISEMIDVPAKTIRKVLRANSDKTPGRGGRYVIAEKDVKRITELVMNHRAKNVTVFEFGDDESDSE